MIKQRVWGKCNKLGGTWHGRFNQILFCVLCALEIRMFIPLDIGRRSFAALMNCFKERSRVFPAPIILSNFFSLKVKMSRYYILGWCVLNSVKSIYLQILLNVYFQSPTSKMGSSKCEWRFGNKLWWVAPSGMLAAPGTTLRM